MSKFKTGGFSNNSSFKFGGMDEGEEPIIRGKATGKTFNYVGINDFADALAYAVHQMNEEMKARKERCKHHFCQPGIKVDKQPEVMRTAEFDNRFGYPRQKIKEGVYLLNQPTGDLYLCFDVTDAVIVE